MGAEAVSGWERFRAPVRGIPFGRVATYGTIAELAGSPRAARQVGFALASLTDDSDVPWHRVVGRRGRAGVGVSLRGPSAELQCALLRDEGIAVDASGGIDGANEWFGGGATPEAAARG